jgi:hypothetical protein
MGAMNELMIDKMNAERARKPQRNDKCACGSGRKFKNCCEKRDRLSQQQAVIEIRAKQQKKTK